MSPALSPGRRRALELGRAAGTIREDHTFTGPDGKPGGKGASAMAKVEKPQLEGASIKAANERSLPFKRS